MATCATTATGPHLGKTPLNLRLPRLLLNLPNEGVARRHDLTAHLNGGIPNADIDELDAYWQVFPTFRRSLFANGKLDAQSLLAGYCSLLYETHNTYEEVARRKKLDRRTVKKHIENA